MKELDLIWNCATALDLLFSTSMPTIKDSVTNNVAILDSIEVGRAEDVEVPVRMS